MLPIDGVRQRPVFKFDRDRAVALLAHFQVCFAHRVSRAFGFKLDRSRRGKRASDSWITCAVRKVTTPAPDASFDARYRAITSATSASTPLAAECQPPRRNTSVNASAPGNAIPGFRYQLSYLPSRRIPPSNRLMVPEENS